MKLRIAVRFATLLLLTVPGGALAQKMESPIRADLEAHQDGIVFTSSQRHWEPKSVVLERCRGTRLGTLTRAPLEWSPYGTGCSADWVEDCATKKAWNRASRGRKYPEYRSEVDCAKFGFESESITKRVVRETAASALRSDSEKECFSAQMAQMKVAGDDPTYSPILKFLGVERVDVEILDNVEGLTQDSKLTLGYEIAKPKTLRIRQGLLSDAQCSSLVSLEALKAFLDAQAKALGYKAAERAGLRPLDAPEKADSAKP